MMMIIPDTTTPVVVLKMEHYGALGVLRSLGRLGVSVYGVETDPHASAFSSKYCSGKFVWDVDHAPPRETLGYLLEVGRKIGQRALLIPTSDETTMFTADYAEALEEWFIFPYQAPELVRTLCNKKKMFYLAKRLGIPTAETLFPLSRADVLNALDQITFPLMLKGIDGASLERRTGKKMVIVRNARELLEHYDAMEDSERPNLMLQEYIHGGDDSVWMFNGYFDKHSECLLGFTGKKIRQNPVYTGMTSLGICLSNEVVGEATKRFMKAIGYHGILDIGYRFDRRDGKYKVLDVNPRIGATFRLFVGLHGMDVARALYLDMTNQPRMQDILCEGRKWVVEDKDLKSSYQYFRAGSLGVGKWLRSLRGIQEGGYYAADDVLPLITMCKAHAVRAIKRSLNLLPAPKPKPAELEPPRTQLQFFEQQHYRSNKTRMV